MINFTQQEKNHLLEHLRSWPLAGIGLIGIGAITNSNYSPDSGDITLLLRCLELKLPLVIHLIENFLEVMQHQ